MGKFAIALLVIAAQLFTTSPARADEQVRQLQEELRKRHLFFADPNGEFTPALVTALARYQKIKGLPASGFLDWETSASLGIPPAAPRVAPTPFVVAKTGDVRGVNGELLPSSTPLFAGVTDSTFPGQSHAPAEEAIEPALPNKSREEMRSGGKGPRSRVRTAGHGSKPRHETNPFVVAYQSVDQALKRMFRESPARKKRDPKKRG